MANDFSNNITRQLARRFLPLFESSRVISKRVSTQLADIKFKPSSGENIDVKRPTDYTSTRSATGDISGSTPDDIQTAKATVTVQDYFTVWVDYDEADEAIKMDQIDELLAPMAQRIVVDFELDFANFLLKRAGLYAGTIGNAATTWDEIAEFGAVMQAVGIPMDRRWTTVINPFTQRSLASNQRSMGAGGAAGGPIKSAHERAIITSDFAGMDVVTGTTLRTYTTGAGADRAGTINGAPDVTYATNDYTLQTIPVTAFNANLPVKAGDRVQVAATNQLNLSTRQNVIDETGANVLWTGTVTADVTLDAGGAGNLTVVGPAIYETAAGKGAYNTVDRALTNGDVITLLGAASTTYQPNLFFHPMCATIASVPIKKLHSTDTLMQTKDGLQMRVSRYANGDANSQTVRFDFRPAWGMLNPFFCGAGYGSP